MTEPTASSSKSFQSHSSRKFWRERVNEWYPRWRERTYFVPPVLMYRTDHDTESVFGKNVKVSKQPVSIRLPGSPKGLQESDVTDDQTQQRVLHCLRTLSERQSEVMFVISNLRFEDYLKAAESGEGAQPLPRPADLKSRKQDRGEFDVLILHRHHGILTCEIKSVGAGAFLEWNWQRQRDVVTERVRKAVRQLNKAGEVVAHLVSDLSSPPPVHRTLILPNVSTSQLYQVLVSCPQVNQELCQCLGIQENAAVAVSLCVTSDLMSNINSPHDVTDKTVQKLVQWWQSLMISKEETVPTLTDDTYLELIARFCGPATTVKVFCGFLKPRLSLMDIVRTEGEGASETAKRFTQIMLTPRQMDVLRSEDLRFVFLTGPPGVGKTLLLHLKGVGLLNRGFYVAVVSTWGDSVAASNIIVRMLQETVGPAAARRVHLYEFDLSRGREEVDTATRTLQELARTKDSAGLFLIFDEAYEKSEFSDLVCALHDENIPGLHLWVASMLHKAKPPPLQEVALTQPLRCPPAVTRQVEQSQWMRRGDVYGYCPSLCPPHADGPAPLHVHHGGEKHAAVSLPEDCLQCGLQVAILLREELHVGIAVTGRSGDDGQPALRHRDVIVLSYLPLSDSHAFVTGLRHGGLPVTVLPARDSAAVADVAGMACEEVVVAWYRDVHGLERKVVVWLQGDRSRSDGGLDSDERLGRLYAVSRCAGQLVLVLMNRRDGAGD